MRRRRDTEQASISPDLRPATPRHEAPRAVPSAVDRSDDPAASVIVTSLGRIQLDLDLVLRRLDRLEALLSGPSQETEGLPD